MNTEEASNEEAATADPKDKKGKKSKSRSPSAGKKKGDAKSKSPKGKKGKKTDVESTPPPGKFIITLCFKFIKINK